MQISWAATSYKYLDILYLYINAKEYYEQLTKTLPYHYAAMPIIHLVHLAFDDDIPIWDI